MGEAIADVEFGAIWLDGNKLSVDCKLELVWFGVAINVFEFIIGVATFEFNLVLACWKRDLVKPEAVDICPFRLFDRFVLDTFNTNLLLIDDVLFVLMLEIIGVFPEVLIADAILIRWT